MEGEGEGVTPEQVRDYLKDLDGLRQEISDLSADIAQYDAMIPEPDSRKEPIQYLNKPPNKTYSNTLIRPMGSPRAKSNVVEMIVIKKLSSIEPFRRKHRQLCNIYMAIQFVYNYLDDWQKDLWEYKYIDGLTNEKTAEMLHVTIDVVDNTDRRKIIGAIIENYRIRI